MTRLNPISEHNIEDIIDAAVSRRDVLLAELRKATDDPVIRYARLAEYRLQQEYLNFLLSGEATKTEHDYDDPLTPAIRRALEQT
jgi:hypothetical protein